MKPEWCLQCGEESRPEKAVGKDADGEPACRMHMVGHATSSAPVINVPPVKLEPVKPAKVVQPEASEAMATSSKGIKPRSGCSICGRSIADFIMAKHMLAKHGQAAKPKREYVIKGNDLPEGGSAIQFAKVPTGMDAMGEGTQSVDPEVSVTLTQTQVRKLLKLLL